MYGDFIRRLREAADLSQAELAKITGTSQPTISAYEHDRRLPSVDALNRIVAGCGFVLTAVAGNKRVIVPFPEAGWFPDEEPWHPPPTFWTDRASRRNVAPAARASQLDAVLELADALRASRA